MNVGQMRKAAGLTQIELACRVRISRGRLSLAECGYVALCAEEVEAIRNAAVGEIEMRAARLKQSSLIGSLDREVSGSVSASRGGQREVED